MIVWPSGASVVVSPPRPGAAESGFRSTSEFNPARKNPVTKVVMAHNGIDLVGFDQIKSPSSGVVTYAGYNGTAGLEVRIREDGTGDVYRLLHNRAVVVKVGQRVSAGQVVALMGSTGQSTGPHCHFETRPKGGAPVDPRTYYAGRRPRPAPAGKPTITPEEGLMYPIHCTTGHRFVIGPGFVRHMDNFDASEMTKNITSPTDQWITLNPSQFTFQLDAFGIPRDKVNMDKGYVLDPSTGTMRRGGMWSWAREASLKADRILAALAKK